MKRNTQILGMALIAGAMALGTTSCKKKGCTDENFQEYSADAEKDDGSCETPVETTNEDEVNKSGEISSNETWTADKVYILNGKVYVSSGTTLTIEPGTIIKGAEGNGTNASALIIAKGAKIEANGTAASPIIFTSELDNIAIGQTTGTNLDQNDSGKWGGLIILGNARISAGDGDVSSLIEGLPATETYGTFGGNDDTDNSGTLTYVSIRHGGALIGAGNEINGLTLGGVGSGTTINNIEVIANLDDGIEFFGGSVDVTNALVGFQGDDGIDIDMNYSGTVDNFFVIGGTSSDEGLEIDGPEGTTYTDGKFTLTNGTVVSATGDGSGADFKSKAQGDVNNVLFSGYVTNAMKFRAAFVDGTGCVDKDDAYLYLTQTLSELDVAVELVGPVTSAASISVYTGTDGAEGCVDGSQVTAADAAVNSSIVTTGTVGGSAADFSWTWATENNISF